jgi:hypothetical protein
MKRVRTPERNLVGLDMRVYFNLNDWDYIQLAANAVKSFQKQDHYSCDYVFDEAGKTYSCMKTDKGNIVVHEVQ